MLKQLPLGVYYGFANINNGEAYMVYHEECTAIIFVLNLITDGNEYWLESIL